MALKKTNSAPSASSNDAVLRSISRYISTPVKPAEKTAQEDTKKVIERYRDELRNALKDVQISVDAQA